MIATTAMMGTMYPAAETSTKRKKMMKTKKTNVQYSLQATTCPSNYVCTIQYISVAEPVLLQMTPTQTLMQSFLPWLQLQAPMSACEHREAPVAQAVGALDPA
jgi:hypothetical protein